MSEVPRGLHPEAPVNGSYFPATQKHHHSCRGQPEVRQRQVVPVNSSRFPGQEWVDNRSVGANPVLLNPSKKEPMTVQSIDATCACASLRRASRAVCRLYDLVLKPTSLKTTQFIILAAIADTGEIAHCDLARRFAASEETFSRRLASARNAGWIRMTIGDHRRRVYSLTDRGRTILQSTKPYWERAQDRMCRELGEVDWKLLAGFAERVTLAAHRAERTAVRNGKTASHPPAAFRVGSPPAGCHSN